MADFKRVLITGGAGFIGSNYVRYALAHHPEWEVAVLDKLTYAGNMANLADVADRISFFRGDIADRVDVAAAMSGANAVVNFAAESHVDRSVLDSRPFVRTNVEGTLVLLEQALEHHVERFLQVSTDEVYGDLSGSDRQSLEADVLKPRSPYAATKAAAEHLVSSYGITHGLDFVITRGSNTYGPNQYPEKIIPLFVTNAIDDAPLPLYNDGSAVRDYLYVEDHCAGVDLVLHAGKSGETYNLGARLEVTGVEVADRIIALLGKPRSLITFVRDRPGHDYRYSIDPSRVEQLGWRRSWDFDHGMLATVRWYEQHQGWWRAITSDEAYRSHQQRWYRNETHQRPST